MTVREYTPPTAAEHAAERIQIVAALEQFAVVATARQLDQLQELLDRTGEANSQFNLTAIRARPDMLVKHVFDSFSLLPFLPMESTSKKSRSGRRMASGSPGKPAPVPMSATRRV